MADSSRPQTQQALREKRKADASQQRQALLEKYCLKMTPTKQGFEVVFNLDTDALEECRTVLRRFLRQTVAPAVARQDAALTDDDKAYEIDEETSEEEEDDTTAEESGSNGVMAYWHLGKSRLADYRRARLMDGILKECPQLRHNPDNSVPLLTHTAILRDFLVWESSQMRNNVNLQHENTEPLSKFKHRREPEPAELKHAQVKKPRVGRQPLKDTTIINVLSVEHRQGYEKLVQHGPDQGGPAQRANLNMLRIKVKTLIAAGAKQLQKTNEYRPKELLWSSLEAQIARKLKDGYKLSCRIAGKEEMTVNDDATFRRAIESIQECQEEDTEAMDFILWAEWPEPDAVIPGNDETSGGPNASQRE